MSPRQSRRALLRAAGIATVTGLAGCGSDGDHTGTGPGEGPETEGSTTYGIDLQNQFTHEDFETTEVLSGAEPATVHLRVDQLDPGSEPYFERTVDVETGGSRSFPDAFTVEPDGPTYAMSAELERFVDDGLSDDHNRRDDLTFAPDERPAANPIRVVVQSLEPPDVERLFPVVSIRTEPVEG